MFRGPLVPTRVAHPLRPNLYIQSNLGSDLQILDPDIGLMDISYYSAWRLGKTLALGDPAFAAALARLRALVHREAIAKVKYNTAKQLEDNGAVSLSRDRIVSETGQADAGLGDLDAALHLGGATTAMTNRLEQRQPVSDTSSGRLHLEPTSGQMYMQALDVLKDVATARDGGLYNYHTVPSNTDYAIVQEWTLDKLHLASIPAHYLLPDHSHVPQETIRLFYIDENWTEALIDGALSLANHSTDDPAEDYCRSALKARLNEYLASPIKGLDYCQQVPTYGFFLRSQILDQFPDVTVSAVFEEQLHSQEIGADTKSTAPILVQHRLSSDLMLLLLDREAPGLIKLQFTLPVHQQTFAIAAALHPKDKDRGRMHDEIEIELQKIFTLENRPVELVDRGDWLGDGSQMWPMQDVFDSESRTMKVAAYARKIHDFHKLERGVGQYTEDMPTSALLALQLKESTYTLNLDMKPASVTEKTDTPKVGSGNPHALDRTRTSLFRFRPPPFPPAVGRASTQPLSDSVEAASAISSKKDRQKPSESIIDSAPTDLLLLPDDFLLAST